MKSLKHVTMDLESYSKANLKTFGAFTGFGGDCTTFLDYSDADDIVHNKQCRDTCNPAKRLRDEKQRHTDALLDYENEHLSCLTASDSTASVKTVPRQANLLLFPSDTDTKLFSTEPTNIFTSFGSKPQTNATSDGTIDWRLMKGSKDAADSLAWITSTEFSKLINLGEKDDNVIHVFERLSDHEKIPESLIEELKHNQKLSVVYKSLRTLRDIFNSYRQYVNVLVGDADMRAVSNKYHGLRISIRRLAEHDAGSLAVAYSCTLDTPEGHHPDRIKIAELLATLNLLAVRTSRVLQEIIDMEGKYLGV